MAKDRISVRRQEEIANIENIKRRLDMLDQRLDDIDSMVSAVIERVMSQPIAIGITCPHCNKTVEITLIGNRRPRT